MRNGVKVHKTDASTKKTQLQIYVMHTSRKIFAFGYLE